MSQTQPAEVYRRLACPPLGSVKKQGEEGLYVTDPASRSVQEAGLSSPR